MGGSPKYMHKSSAFFYHIRQVFSTQSELTWENIKLGGANVNQPPGISFKKFKYLSLNFGASHFFCWRMITGTLLAITALCYQTELRVNLAYMIYRVAVVGEAA
jgi:hypothetical protein